MMYFALTWIIAASGSDTNYIGWTNAQVWSPDRRYVVVNIVTDEGMKTRIGENELWLIDVKEAAAAKCYTYNRNVEILWSPDSSRFALNDYEASNEAGCVLETPSMKDGKLTILETSLSEALVAQDKSHNLQRMGHRYVTAKKWADGQTLQIESSGYDPVDEKLPSDVEFVYNYSVTNDAFEKVERASSDHKSGSEAKPLHENSLKK